MTAKTRPYVIDARTVDVRFPGIGRYTENLIRALAQIVGGGERLAYICNAAQKEALGIAETERVKWLASDASPFGMRQQWEIPALLQRVNASIYHSPYFLMPYFARTKTILTVYDLIPHYFPEYVSTRARLFFKWATRLALRKAVHAIAISDATRDDFSREYGGPAGTMSTIHLAAAGHFRPASREAIDGVRERYGLAGPYVLYVGSNKPHKNLTTLVRAWQRLDAKARGEHALVLAGRFDSRYEEPQRAIAQLPATVRVHVLNDVDDAALPALYSGATLFVFPSHYEGFGLPVLEAMACGCAVACANSSSLPEVAGEAAMMFDAHDSGDICGAIERLLSDEALRQAYQRRGLERAQLFSWEQTAAQTLEIYRQHA